MTLDHFDRITQDPGIMAASPVFGVCDLRWAEYFDKSVQVKLDKTWQ